MKKELPAQDKDSEESLIASLILNNNLFDDCEYLDPDDFYSTPHKLIFETMLFMRSRETAIDVATLYYELDKKDIGEQVGGPGYLLRLIEQSPVFNTKQYVKIVKECSLTRQIKTKCMNLLDSKDVGEELLSNAQSSLLNIKATNSTDDIKRVGDIVISHFDRLEKANNTESGIYYKLGFPRIDRCLKTIGPKLIIIAGRPGMGKTSLAVTIARNFDKEGIKSGFLSIEMPENEIIDRWLSMESDVDSAKFGKYHGFSTQDVQAVNDAAAVLYDSEIMIDATGSLDIVDVERKCRKLKKDGIQAIFIDQLSQIGNRKIKSGELTTLYAENCTRIARLKKELDLPIFLMCQLNRDMKLRAVKDPILSDLKQSGKIEEDADAVIFVHRPEEYVPDGPEKNALHGRAVLNVAKNRAGATFRDNKIMFKHETTYFYQGDVF